MASILTFSQLTRFRQSNLSSTTQVNGNYSSEIPPGFYYHSKAMVLIKVLLCSRQGLAEHLLDHYLQTEEKFKFLTALVASLQSLKSDALSLALCRSALERLKGVGFGDCRPVS